MSNSAPYKIPIVDLRAQYGYLSREIHEAMDDVLQSQQFILGPAVDRFERELSNYLRCNFAVGVASGSDALLLALMALDIGRGDGVIVPPFTFFSTVSAITRLGATPLFVDIGPKSYLISVHAVEAFLDNPARSLGGHAVGIKPDLSIKALLPVHLFGQCCDMAAILELAKKYSLRVVEDVAQAYGARTRVSNQMKYAGTLGDLGCFSFFPSKNLGGYGDGGLVCGDDAKLIERLRMLRVHGESEKYHHRLTGINSRLDSIQAAVLSVKQRYIEEWCNRRIQRAQTYYRLFIDSGLVGEQIHEIPALVTDRSHVFNNYVIRAERRDDLKQFLANAGIQSEIYYPLPLHLQTCFAELGYKTGDFPQAELAAKQVLALPLYPELSPAQQEAVVGTIKKFFDR
ncbi:MAG: DegT/DnrJ/EryC1/StrS family aminotransferase [Alphaproteobacteria bacterium]